MGDIGNNTKGGLHNQVNTSTATFISFHVNQKTSVYLGSQNELHNASHFVRSKTIHKIILCLYYFHFFSQSTRKPDNIQRDCGGNLFRGNS